jgi:hypothetical protein
MTTASKADKLTSIFESVDSERKGRILATAVAIAAIISLRHMYKKIREGSSGLLLEEGEMEEIKEQGRKEIEGTLAKSGLLPEDQEVAKSKAESLVRGDLNSQEGEK